MLCDLPSFFISRQEVVLLENEISFNEAVIEEREQGIQEVQQQIVEVNEIFKDLAVLVHDQGAMIGKSLNFSSKINSLNPNRFLKICFMQMILVAMWRMHIPLQRREGLIS